MRADDIWMANDDVTVAWILLAPFVDYAHCVTVSQQFIVCVARIVEHEVEVQ